MSNVQHNTCNATAMDRTSPETSFVHYACPADRKTGLMTEYVRHKLNIQRVLTQQVMDIHECLSSNDSANKPDAFHTLVQFVPTCARPEFQNGPAHKAVHKPNCGPKRTATLQPYHSVGPLYTLSALAKHSPRRRPLTRRHTPRAQQQAQASACTHRQLLAPAAAHRHSTRSWPLIPAATRKLLHEQLLHNQLTGHT
ncbi:hypothetical protein COO60DRAFT_205625 [Scenedesmus sp. NREL 46B-D3]|nr:hypothetical protein COO60DRAFT_205625 [Scenedesmus sp. NREL 46B-D3]